jgi:hypothetical protein
MGWFERYLKNKTPIFRGFERTFCSVVFGFCQDNWIVTKPWFSLDLDLVFYLDIGF